MADPAKIEWEKLMASGRSILVYSQSFGNEIDSYKAGRAWVGQAQTFLQRDGDDLDRDYPGQNLVDSLGTVYDRIVNMVNGVQDTAITYGHSPLKSFAETMAKDVSRRLGESSNYILLAVGLVAAVLIASKLR